MTESKNDQQHMPSLTGLASALVMIKAQFLLKLLVALLNPEPFMKETNHFQGRLVLGHIAEEIQELIFALVFLRQRKLQRLAI